MNCPECNCQIKTGRVLGWGDKNSPLAIVGEAPGREELRQGVPFIGKAGKELQKVLDELKVDRNKLFITNSVCYMPTNAEGKIVAPEKEEINSCRPRLAKEINEVNPKVILCLGKTSAQAVTGLESTKMGSLRADGELKALPVFNNNPKVIVTWHPSFIARGNLKARPQFFSDIQKALVESGIITVDEDKYETKILLDFDQIFSYLKEMRESNKFFSFDFETTGGKIATTKVIGVSFCYKWDEAIYIPLLYRDTTGKLCCYHTEQTYIDIIEEIVTTLLSSNPKTAFNKKYELEVSKFSWGINIPRIVIDPFLTYYMRHVEEKYPSLEFMTELYFPKAKTLKAEIKNSNVTDYSIFPLEKIGRYGAEDSLFGFRIAIIERKKLEEIQGYYVN